MIETAADLKAARHTLGWSVNQMADALRLGGASFAAARRVREMESGERLISGPISVAVELLLRERGLE